MLPKIDPLNWSYAAGMLDGEGCVNAQISKNKRPGGRYGISFCPQIVLVNTYGPALGQIRFFLESEGINCNLNPVGPREPKTRASGGTEKQKFQLMVGKGKPNVLKFIDIIEPYTIIKTQDLQLLRRIIKEDLKYHGQRWTVERLKRLYRLVLSLREAVHPHWDNRVLWIDRLLKNPDSPESKVYILDRGNIKR